MVKYKPHKRGFFFGSAMLFECVVANTACFAIVSSMHSPYYALTPTEVYLMFSYNTMVNGTCIFSIILSFTINIILWKIVHSVENGVWLSIEGTRYINMCNEPHLWLAHMLYNSFLNLNVSRIF